MGTRYDSPLHFVPGPRCALAISALPGSVRFPFVGLPSETRLSAPSSALTFAHSERALQRQQPRSLDTTSSRVTQLARALTMRVYEAKLVYSLVSLGDETQLNHPAKIAEYLRSAFCGASR